MKEKCIVIYLDDYKKTRKILWLKRLVRKMKKWFN